MPRFLRRLLARTGQTSPPLRRLRSGQRLRLETLEIRANPVAFTFVPYSVVAANPTWVPSTALIQFNPLPNLVGVLSASGSFHQPIALEGSFHQALVSPTGSAAETGHLDVTYNVHGSVNSTIVQPGPSATQPGFLTADYTLSGHITEVLTLPGATPQSAWTITGDLTETGTVSGPLNWPVAGATVVDPIAFTSIIGLTQSELRVASTAGGGETPWAVQSTIQSAGKFQVNATPPISAAATLVSPFTLQDQISGTLAPVSAVSTPPQPPIRVTAVDNATGSVTTPAFRLSTSGIPTGFGTTQYVSQLAETLVSPPSPTNPGWSVTENETFNTLGTFQNFGLLPPVTLTPGPAPLDGALDAN
jgi:hypothetical protein